MVDVHVAKYSLSEKEKKEAMEIGEKRAIAWIRRHIQKGGQKILRGEGGDQKLDDFDYVLKGKIICNFQKEELEKAERNLHQTVSGSTAKKLDIASMARRIAEEPINEDEEESQEELGKTGWGFVVRPKPQGKTTP
jgi:hypothetical protein